MEGCPEGGNTVLTREQAKKQPCPLMPTTKSYEYHANGAGIAYEAIEYGKCAGEECPKWRDGKVDGGKCSYNGDCRKAVCNCTSCPDRYGYCGG
ncbi:hypothetical protein HMPREF0178_04039 [Bilophila sp. 4_1_30]|nr:hypothetical protein HMPREF0178_04039 [Bilophila sp. 4_1_30]